MKIHTVGTNLFHVDRQTNLTKLSVALCNFVTHLKNKNSNYRNNQYSLPPPNQQKI